MMKVSGIRSLATTPRSAKTPDPNADDDNILPVRLSCVYLAPFLRFILTYFLYKLAHRHRWKRYLIEPPKFFLFQRLRGR